MARIKAYQRPDGLYEISRVIDGKRKVFRGHTVREIEQKMLSYQTEKQSGPLFEAAAEQWWGDFVENAASNSLKGYRPAYQRAVEHFAGKRLLEITAKDIKHWVNGFIRKDFAKKTIQTHIIVMSNIFKRAQEEYNIDYNPAALVRLPSDLPQKKRQLPSDEEDARMMASFASHPFGLFPLMAKYTGARRGELLGLRFGDIDRESKTIRIERSVYHEGTTPKIKPPKTEAGKRIVPLLDIVEEHLPDGPADHYIFGGETPLASHQFDALWESYCKFSGITSSPHQWRHMYATILFDADIPVKDAQILMGHAQFSTTMDVYTHAKEQRISKSAAKLNSFVKTANYTEKTQQH